jgi:hypothetical protein
MQHHGAHLLPCISVAVVTSPDQTLVVELGDLRPDTISSLCMSVATMTSPSARCSW